MLIRKSRFSMKLFLKLWQILFPMKPKSLTIGASFDKWQSENNGSRKKQNLSALFEK